MPSFRYPDAAIAHATEQYLKHYDDYDTVEGLIDAIRDEIEVMYGHKPAATTIKSWMAHHERDERRAAAIRQKEETPIEYWLEDIARSLRRLADRY